MKTVFKNTLAIPGLVDLSAIPIQNVSSISSIDHFGNIIYYDINIKENPNLYHFQAALDSHTLMVRSVNSDAGTHYNGRFSCFVAGLLPGNHNVFKEMKNQRFVVIYKDYLDNLKCFGDPGIGLSVDFTERASPRSGFEIVFSGDAVLEPLSVRRINIEDEGESEPEESMFFVDFEKHPDKSYIFAGAAAYHAQPNKITITTYADKWLMGKALSAKFVGWEVVSGDTPENFVSSDQTMTIVLLSNCTLKAVWEIS